MPTTPPASDPPPGYAHRAPPEAWRPMSGLCLSAFVLALVLAVLAVLSLWVAAVLPFVLGVLGLLRVDGSRFRGRALAGWATVIAAGSGAAGWLQTSAAHRHVERLAGGVVAALRAERPEAERDALLDAWLAPTTDRDAVRERLQERFALVVSRAGPVTDAPRMPSLAGGVFPLAFPPQDAEPVDLPAGATADGPAGVAFWVRVPFQRAELHLALVLGEATISGVSEPLEKLALAGGAPAPVLRDARWYARKGALALPPAPAPSPAPAPGPTPPERR